MLPLELARDLLDIASVARVAGIDQQRLPIGCDEERRLSALDVDEIDVERPRSLLKNA